MRLLAFRVREFRSVDDSGWIETNQVTGLIGTNESGKTNVLVPLWKLNPAKGGEIDAIADYPRKRYNEIRAMKKKPIFIEARFELPTDLRTKVAGLIKVPLDRVGEAIVKRDFDGAYYVSFPNADGGPTVARTRLVSDLASAGDDVAAADAGDDETAILQNILAVIANARRAVEAAGTTVDSDTLTDIASALATVDLTGAPKHSVAAARFGQLVKTVTGYSKDQTDWHAARTAIYDRLPSFVYYSNYGNLDSEIYLPHVIENLKRSDLGQREQAKARTLKVLFDFVKLRPEEIKELGNDVNIPANTKLTVEQEEQIAATARKKKERDILLQSASTELTRKFRDWWKQGDYRFRFAADGNHFRIWVADDKRPEDIELEARSTGLQWFFSFYLVFLVESEDSHNGAVLLLDEPGMSLHPLAQADLSAFFDGLADTNQLVYTTHSPFMVDADHLDRARAVYTDKNGVTRVSPDLRAPLDKSEEAKSVYAAYAALGMSVSQALMLGCQAVIVEGPSDQHYASAMKNYLISKGHLRPIREILFMPSGGVRGVKAVCSLVMGKDDELPFVVLDADDPGVKFAAGLRSGLYQGVEERVLSVGGLLPDIVNAEFEDMFPPRFIAKTVDRYLPKPSDLDEDFLDVVEEGKAIVPQIEAYAVRHRIELAQGWKVDLAKRVKTAVLRSKEDPFDDAASHLAAWQGVFEALQSPVVQSVASAEGVRQRRKK